MKNIAFRVTHHVDMHIVVYSTNAALKRAWNERDGDTEVEMEEPGGFFRWAQTGVRYDLSIHLSEESPDIEGELVHESNHAAAEIWRIIRKRKAFRGLVPCEMRAYIQQDICTLFRNWRKHGFKPHEDLMDGLFLPNMTRDFEGVKRTRKPKQRNEKKNS